MSDSNNPSLIGIPTYNLICHFVPGVIFVYLLKFTYGIDSLNLVGGGDSVVNFVASLALFFVLGVVINRLGSELLRIISPLPKIENWYEQYVIAKKYDGEIAKLIEMKELYKSIVMIVILVPVVGVVNQISIESDTMGRILIPILGIFAILLFLNSYKKQDAYINRRIASHSSNKNENNIL